MVSLGAEMVLVFVDGVSLQKGWSGLLSQRSDSVPRLWFHPGIPSNSQTACLGFLAKLVCHTLTFEIH